MSIQIPANLLDAARRANAPLAILLVAIALNESPTGADGDYTVDGVNFYPASQAPSGSHPTSFGPLQLHTPGGLGDGYQTSQLRDWVTNFTIGAQYIQNRLGQGASIQDALAPWTTRAADYATYLQIQAMGIATTPPASPVIPTVPGPPGLMQGVTVGGLLIGLGLAYALLEAQ